MLVRSPLLTSHKWRELVPSGRLVYRCHDVFLWCCVFLFCFALLCFVFRLYTFVEAAALRSIVLRYAGAPIATRVSLFIWRCRFFRVFFVLFPLSLGMESTSYVLSFRMVFFCLVTTGWIFDISLCENSINQSNLTYDSADGSQHAIRGYQSHLLQRCHPACGHEGSSHRSSVLALLFFIAKHGQHSYNSSTMLEF